MPTTADERAYAEAAPEQPQERMDFQDWFKRHQTAILIVGVVGVVLTAVVIFRGNQSQSASGAAGVAPAATVDSSTSQALDNMTQALQNLLNTFSGSGGGGGSGGSGGTGTGGSGGGGNSPPNYNNQDFRAWLNQQTSQAPSQLASEQYRIYWNQLLPYLYATWQAGGSINWDYISNYPNGTGSGSTGGAGGWPPGPVPRPGPLPLPSPNPPPGSWQPAAVFAAIRNRISFPPQPGSGQLQTTTFTYSGPPGSTLPPPTLKAGNGAASGFAPAPPVPAQPGATGIAWSAGGAPSFVSRVESRRG